MIEPANIIDEFTGAYSAMFGEFPGKKDNEEMKFWKGFIKRLAIEEVVPLITEVAERMGDSIKKPRLKEFRKAHRDLVGAQERPADKQTSKEKAYAYWAKTFSLSLREVKDHSLSRLEFSWKLSIKPHELPAYAKDLTPKQRETLDIPEPEEMKILWAKVYKELDRSTFAVPAAKEEVLF